MFCVVYVFVDEIGFRVGDDGVFFDIYGDVYYVVGGDYCRGGVCYSYLGVVRGFEVRGGIVGGVYLRFGVVGIGRSFVRKREGFFFEF